MTNGAARFLHSALSQPEWADDHRTQNLATAMCCQLEDAGDAGKQHTRAFQRASLRAQSKEATVEDAEALYAADDTLTVWNKAESTFRQGAESPFSDKEFQVCVNAINAATKKKTFLGTRFHLELREMFKLTE